METRRQEELAHASRHLLPLLVNQMPRTTRWSSRISCMSGLWSPGGMNNTKPLRVYTRSQLLRAFAHSGRRRRDSWSVWGSSRWTIGSRASFRFLRDRVHRDRCRPREPAGYYLRSSRGLYPILTRRTATTHSFVDPGSTEVVDCPLAAPRKKSTQLKSLPVAKARSAKKAAKRRQARSPHLLRCASAKPNSRQ